MSLDVRLHGHHSGSGACRAAGVLLCQPSASCARSLYGSTPDRYLRRMLAKISCRQMSSSQVALCNMTRLHPAVLSSSRPLLALKVSGQGSLIFGNVFSDEGCIVAKCLPAAVSAQQIASPGQKDSASDKRGWISAIAVILTAPSGLCSMMLC